MSGVDFTCRCMNYSDLCLEYTVCDKKYVCEYSKAECTFLRCRFECKKFDI
jgi:hypothetical protein